MEGCGILFTKFKLRRLEWKAAAYFYDRNYAQNLPDPVQNLPAKNPAQGDKGRDTCPLQFVDFKKFLLKGRRPRAKPKRIISELSCASRVVAGPEVE